MKVSLIGYGKMGRAIEQVLPERKHTLAKIVDINNADELRQISQENTDVVIEFTSPESAYHNIRTCLERRVPVVSGSTGWLDRKKEIEAYCLKNDVAFFYASNYSLGVNIFFRLNRYLAKMMNGKGYTADLLEIHHTQKLDAPSGTAITLAESILAENESLTHWVNEETEEAQALSIISERVDEVPGTHEVTYDSAIDQVNISHVAHSRKGFAAGAVLAAEFLKGKQGGVYAMDDLLPGV